MKAVTWHGKRDVRVETVPDPEIEAPTDAIIRMSSTNNGVYAQSLLSSIYAAGSDQRRR